VSSLDRLADRLLGDHPRPGTLYGIGAGPGDPGLLTLRAAALLRRLDLVAVPRSVRGRGVAAQAVAAHIDPDRLLELVSDMPVDSGAVAQGWRGRVAPLVEALDQGRSVGMVTDGDPSLYSTFAHAAAAVLEARPATELAVVPGVPSMCAAAAVEARPLAVGAERLAVLPASRLDDGELEAAVATADTVVLLKAGTAMRRLRTLLEGPARGWSVRYARRVGLEGEEHADDLDGAAADYMALVILRRPRGGSRGSREALPATDRGDVVPPC
jgi:precorrin-2/cobalt-factor-2 C20-methyltransferase